MTVLATMVSLICLSFIFGIVTTASIPRQKRNPKPIDVTIILTTKKVTTASIPRKKVTTASIPKRRGKTTKSTITITTASIPKRRGKTTKSTITTTTRKTPAKICTTQNCAIAATTISKKMNLSVDPCLDFNEYACGRFIAETAYPVGRTKVDSFNIVEDENNLILKQIVQKTNRNEPRYLQNMKRLYRSCTNEAKIEQIGLKPYLKDKQFIDDWPTLNRNWSESSFNLNDVITRYERVFIEPLFSYNVLPDLKDSNKNALYISEPDLGLTREYFLRPRNDTVIMAYQTYLKKVAVELGADRNVAELDAKDVVDLKIALTKIRVPKEQTRDYSKLYNPVDMVELKQLYPDINIPRALRAAFETAKIRLLDNETVINVYPTYIGNLSLVIKNFTKRTVQNLFGFTYAISKVGGLTKKLRTMVQQFEKVHKGKMAESPRWEVCQTLSSDIFPLGIAKEFLKRKFTESSKDYMERMINNIEEEFRKMFHENTWMGQATKDEAYKKLKAIKRKIGYPATKFEEKDIEKIYENYTMLKDRYYDNCLRYMKLNSINILLTLRKPADKNEWDMPVYDTNAYYSALANEIVFPAGILQPPFFSKTFQDSMNYGGVGSVIGHEIMHAFDDEGSQYDENGNMRNWWQTSDRDNFVNRTQCIIDQNSNFYISDINMTLNGINLQGESVGDTVGLKESFRAYKEQVRQNGERPRLPRLNLTHDQIFFLGFAQLWCEKSTQEELINKVIDDTHPPGKYRIIGALQNSEDFARAYNCPRGSYMNPKTKCSIW